MSHITSAQLRAARALLRWRAEDLASAAVVGVATVRRAEGGDGPLGMTAANEAAIRRALEAQGVQFLEQGDTAGGAGVALKS